MEISEFEVDSSVIENGDWIEIAKDVKVKLRGYGNADYRRREAEMEETRVLEFGFAGAPVERLAADNLRLFCETVLVDWAGLTEKGEPLAYSVDKGIEYLSNPDYGQFRKRLENQATLLTFRKKKNAEAAIKN